MEKKIGGVVGVKNDTPNSKSLQFKLIVFYDFDINYVQFEVFVSNTLFKKSNSPLKG